LYINLLELIKPSRKSGRVLFQSQRVPDRPKRGRAALVLVLLGLGLAFAACGGKEADRPSMVLVVFDTLRPDHTGPLGYERATTPNLVRLAENGILFEDATASAAFTLPSMATLFTSLDPVEHGVRRHLDPEGIQDRLSGRFVTLAERLKSEGYATAAVVSNSLFLLKFGFDQGFDTFDAGGRRDAGPTTDAALAWLKQRPKDRPFFLWVHYIDPHWPYNAPAEFKRPFRRDDGGQYQHILDGFKRKRIKSDQIYFDNRLGPDGIARAVAEYDNEIAYADLHMGRLLDHLKSEGIYDETLIAAVSDHGESLGEHELFFAHSFYLYEEIQQALMLLKPPRSSAAARVDHPVRLLDFLPTVLSLLGMDPAEGMRGRDLSPLWSGEGKAASFPDLPTYAESEPRYRTAEGLYRYPHRKRIHMEGNEGKWRMMREGRFKLIHIPGEGRELYDLSSDPDETRNIVNERPAVAERLMDMLERIMDQDKDAALPEPARTGERDQKTIEEIQALGYGN
jgi:arylsulfatase A-like enzyme